MYRGKTPSARQLVADLGMHRATAYRWLRALRMAKAMHAGATNG
jgi:hypothetical protein